MREEEFHATCYRPVRDALKRSELNNFNRDELKEIDHMVEARLRDGASDVRDQRRFDPASLQAKFLTLQFHLRKHFARLRREAKAPVAYKAISVSLEFRDYLGGLTRKERGSLGDLSQELLQEIRKPRGTLGARERELLKEQIRLVSVHANQLYREGNYHQFRRVADVLKRAVDEKLRPASKCRTVLGGICFVEGKMFRNTGRYPASEKSLSEAVELYADWSHDHRSPEDAMLAAYKSAMSLGVIAWTKNMRGSSRDALTIINSARLLVRPTGWELDKAHLDLIYADIIRTFLGFGHPALKEAIEIAQNSYDVFERHPHGRLKSRAAFTLALLHYYAGDCPAAEARLKEVEQFSVEQDEARWLVNALILLARIRNKQKEFAVALEHLLPAALNKAEALNLDDRVVVAHIVKSEAHLGLGESREAIDALTIAQRGNDRRRSEDSEDPRAVNSERNKGWIYLNLARAYLLEGDLARSKHYLGRWNELEGVQYKWLHDLAADINREHGDALPSDFVISRDADSLAWKENESDLACWLIEMARRRTGSDEGTTLARVLGLSTKRFGQLRRMCEERTRTAEP